MNELLELNLINRYPGTGQYNHFYEEGVYTCAGCNTPLYKSTTKFNSGCGWPAFYEGLPGAINRHVSRFSDQKVKFFLLNLYGLISCMDVDIG